MNTPKHIINRVARAQGHLAKVRKMLEEGHYCPEIIHQSQAVQAALKKVDDLVLENHLHTCVLKEIKGNKQERQKLIDEIVEVFEKQS